MPATNCPSREELFAFAVGTLPEDRAEDVVEHLSTCAGCRDTLQVIDEGEDTLVARLRRPPVESPFAAEPHREELVARAKELVPVGGRPIELPPTETAVFLELGEYQLLEKLGEGGMGAVYKARQTRLKKIVALKVLPKKRMEDQKAVARFEREMEAIGQLNHPNIIQAYDAREIEGTPILVTEYVEGLNLSELVRRIGPLAIPDACEIIRQAAVGLQYAHEHGLVHRDIKPSNLMLSVGERGAGRGAGERSGQPAAGSGQWVADRKSEIQNPKSEIPAPAAGCPLPAACCVKILDLGLALLAGSGGEQDGELTASGQMMGTLDYMAPEQGMDSHDVDIRADIYSLGATLYKLLCGRAPFGSAKYSTPVKKMMALATSPIPPITEHRQDVPEELITVLDHMLAKDPADRFSTPAEVSAALEPFTTGCDLSGLLHQAEAPAELPVELDQSRITTDEYHSSALVGTQPAQAPPRPLSRRERARVRAIGPLARLRERVGVRGLRHRKVVAIAAGLLPLMFALGIVIWINRDGRKTKLDVPDESEVAIDRRGNVDVKLPGEAEKPAFGPLTIGPPIKVEPIKLEMKPDPDAWTHLVPGQPLSTMALVQEPAKIEGVRSWTLETVGHRGGTYCLAYRPDGLRFVTGGDDGTIRVWDAASGRLVQALVVLEATICDVCWSPDGQVVTAYDRLGNLHMWEAETGRSIQSLPGLPQAVDLAAWSPDGRRFAAFTKVPGPSIWVWDVQSRTPPIQLRGQSPTVLAIAWSPDGRSLASLESDNTLRLWDPRGGGLRRAFKGPVGEVATRYPRISWSPDGRYVGAVILAEGYELCIWDVVAGEVRERIPVHSAAPYQSVAWSSCGNLVAAGSYHTAPSVKVWDIVAGREVWRADQRPGGQGLAFSPDGSGLAQGSFYGDVCVYEARSGRETWCAPGDRSGAYAILSPDGRCVVTGHWGPQCGAGAVGLWETESGRVLCEIPTPSPSDPLGASWSPDGTLLAIEEGNKCVSVWNADRGRLVRRLPVMPSRHCPVWSPDGTLLATVSNQSVVQVWEVGLGRLRRTLPGKCSAPDFSPDGKWLAVAVDRDAQCYDLATGHPGPTFAGADCPIEAVAWSPDGKTVAAATCRRRLLLWDATSGELKQDHDLGRAWSDVVGLLRWTDDSSALVVGGHETLSVYDTKLRVVTQTASSRFIPGCFSSAAGGTIAVPGASLIDLRSMRDLRLRHTILLLRGSQPAVLSPQGHWRGSAGLGKELVYVALTDSGEQITLTPEEFTKKYGWKNDPAKVPGKAESGKPKAEKPAPASQAEPPTAAPKIGPSGPRPEVVPVDIPAEPVAIKPGQPLSRLALVTDPPQIAGLRSWTIEPIGHRSIVVALEYSPDGRYLASSSWDGKIVIWDAARQLPARTLLGHESIVTSVSWSPDGRYLASAGSYDRTLRFWDVQAGRLLRTHREHHPIRSVAWSPDGRWVLLGLETYGEPGGLKLWDVAGSTIARVAEEAASAMRVAWRPDGQMIATLGLADDGLHLWEFPSFKARHTCKITGTHGGTPLCWSPDGQRLAWATDSVDIWDLVLGRRSSLTPPDLVGVYPAVVAFCGDSNILALAGGTTEASVRVWNTRAGTQESLPSPPDAMEIKALAFCPATKTLAAGALNNTIHLHQEGSGWRRLPGHAGTLVYVALSPDAQTLAYVKRDDTARLWKTDSPTAMRDLGRLGEGYLWRGNLAWSADGNSLSATSDATLGVWDLSNRIGPLRVPCTSMQVRLSPDGAMTATHFPQLKLWDAKAGMPVWDAGISGRGLDWSPDGSLLAAGSGKDVVIVDPREKKTVKTLSGCKDEVCAIAWSGDGKSVAAKPFGRQLCVWDIPSGRLARDWPQGALPESLTLQWLPSGKTLVCGSWEAVGLLDIESGRCEPLFLGGNRWREPAISADGRHVAWGFDGMIRVHRLPDGKVLRTLLSLRGQQDAIISPDGHYVGPADMDMQIVYVVLTDSGEQITLTPEEFAKKYGWKNDPAKVMGKAESGKPKAEAKAEEKGKQE